MLFSQGPDYKDDSAPEAVSAPSTATEESTTPGDEELEIKGRKFPLKLLVVGGVVIAAIIVIVISVLSVKMRNAPDLEPEITDDIVDDSYWEAFEEPEITFSYTKEEVAELRAWGYTGDEIEAAELAEESVAALVAASRAEQEQMRETLSNPESPEYRALLNQTWLGQELMTLPGYEAGVTERSISYSSGRINADYEKIPARGHNLYLKVYLPDGSACFMECPLDRYIALPDSGNIVVTYEISMLGDVTVISGMREVPIS